MAINYEARMDELAAFCLANYTLERRPLELILCGLLDCTPYMPVWWAYESPKHPFWEHLDSYLRLEHPSAAQNLDGVKEIGRYRYVRPWSVNRDLDVLLEDRSHPRVWIDGYFRRPKPPIRSRSRYQELASEFLILPVDLSPVRAPSIQQEAEFLRLIR